MGTSTIHFVVAVSLAAIGGSKEAKPAPISLSGLGEIVAPPLP